MAKKVLLFAPVAFNLAETTRMIEIAKGIRNHPAASEAFEVQFISDGGELEHLIEDEGFALHRMEPRLTVKQIEHIGKVDIGLFRFVLGEIACKDDNVSLMRGKGMFQHRRKTGAGIHPFHPSFRGGE